ncbi:PREDICTED: uncharacterized protein LOC109583310 [Amphimedon queenslandica]|uniref:SET domain-containing protein n=1 Tax=Amphimedon queenslandica TaxID=400682 RepID=A0AAN0JAR5_AMPQE|nr:PREDICTED: uncharacterized protein LOC109583310 [Amphimedon queenslandica]|eukprot:XP_019854155.1 PREDICTED: uncharacterized protein LOC109583310 [Amphimedon queenslandica]
MCDSDKGKSLLKAYELKDKGNVKFKAKQYLESMRWYTKALFNAPCPSSSFEGTLEMFRESCDEILQDALNDIAIAWYHGYPIETFKLYRRKALCLAHLGKKVEALGVIKGYKDKIPLNPKVLLNECKRTDLNTAIEKLTSTTASISASYKAVLGLNVSEEGLKNYDKEFMEKYSVMLTELYCITTPSQSTSLQELIKRHMLQIKDNYFLVHTNVLPPNCQQMGPEMANVDETKLGCALYLTASLFNHSCDHNMLRKFIGNRIQVLAYTDSLTKEDELCLSYGPKIGHIKRTERLKELKKTSFFDCSCVPCVNPKREMLLKEYGWYGMVCPHCKVGLLPEPDDPQSDTTSECIDCRKQTDVKSLLEQGQELLQNCRESSTLRDLENNYEKLAKVLYKYNKSLCDICKLIASYYVDQGDYCKASFYYEKRIEALEVIHGPNSIELCSALPNYSRVLEAKDTKKSVKVAKRALRLVELFYGPDDEDAKLLRDFLKK